MSPLRSWVRSSAFQERRRRIFWRPTEPAALNVLVLQHIGNGVAHNAGCTGGPPPSSPEAIDRSSPAIRSEASSTSPRRLRQVSVTAASSCRKFGFG